MISNNLKCLFSTAILLAAFSPQLFAEPHYYGEKLCAHENFKCIKIKRNDTWAKLFPNEKEREIVKRFNRTNMALQFRPWIIVPKFLSTISLMELSPFPKHIATIKQKTILINLSSQAFGAYGKDGNLLKWGPVSAGQEVCPDTKTPCNTIVGQFKISNKKGSECVSGHFPIDTNGGSPMPFCMYFYRGFTIHGSTLPGYNGSHGCVRLFFEDAQWLNQHFATIGTRTIVSN